MEAQQVPMYYIQTSDKDLKSYVKETILTVTFLKAKSVKSANFFSKNSSDSFCTIQTQFDTEPQQTPVCFNTVDPEWNFPVEIKLGERPYNPKEEQATLNHNELIHPEILFINVWGRHKISSNTFLGRAEVPVSLVVSSIQSSNSEGAKSGYTCWFKLTPKPSKVIKAEDYTQMTGTILLNFKYEEKVMEVYTQPAVPAVHLSSNPNASMSSMMLIPPPPLPQQSSVAVKTLDMNSEPPSSLQPPTYSYPSPSSHPSIYPNLMYPPIIHANNNNHNLGQQQQQQSQPMFFQCHKCKAIYSADIISQHVTSCFGSVVDSNPQPHLSSSNENLKSPSLNSSIDHQQNSDDSSSVFANYHNNCNYDPNNNNSVVHYPIMQFN